MSSSMQNAAYSLTIFNILEFFHIVILGAQNSHVMAVPLFFRCFNEVATKFNLPQFFTRGTHSKIYPSVASSYSTVIGAMQAFKTECSVP